MDINSVFINLSGILFIFATLWWFFGSKPKTTLVERDEPIIIKVQNGVYEPARLQIPVGKAIKLQFIRYDRTPCAESVTFPQLKMSYPLPVDKKVDIIIPPQQTGEIDFTCQMGMYRGKLIVV